jgi:hypothetical protein
LEEGAVLLLKDSEQTFATGQTDLAMREYRDGLMLMEDALAIRRDVLNRVSRENLK